NAFFVVAQLSERTHTDLWTYRGGSGSSGTGSGRSLKKGFEAIRPYIVREKEWTGPQIHAFNFLDAVPLLVRGAAHYGCADCMGGVQRIEGDENERAVYHLL